MKDFSFYVVDAKSPSGATACIEVVQGREKLAQFVYDLEQSDHKVYVYKTVPVDFEVYTNSVSIDLYGEE